MQRSKSSSHTSPAPFSSSFSLLSIFHYIHLLYLYLFSTRDLHVLNSLTTKSRSEDSETDTDGSSSSLLRGEDIETRRWIPDIRPSCRKFIASNSEGGEGGRGLIRTFLSQFWVRIVILFLPRILEVILSSVLPYFVYLLLLEFEAADVEGKRGDKFRILRMLGLAVGSMFLQVLRAIIWEVAWHKTYELKVLVRKLIVAVLHWKTLRVPLKATSEETNKVASLLGMDPERLAHLVFLAYEIPIHIVRFVVALVYVWAFLGWIGIAFSGGVIVVVLLPLNVIFLRYSKGLDKEKCEAVDKRVSLVKEAIENIRFIKAFHWEGLYEKKIRDVRTREGNLKRKQAYAWNGIECLWICTGFFITAAAIGGYSLFRDEPLDMASCFSVITVIGSLTWPIFQFASSFGQINEGNTSRKRILRYLSQPEVSGPGSESGVVVGEMADEPWRRGEEEGEGVFGNSASRSPSPSRSEIEFVGCDFAWPLSTTYDAEDEEREEAPKKADPEEEEEGKEKLKQGPFLKDINLSIASGEFIAVIGSIGSGKTCFANALLRELKCKGRCYYASDAPIGFCTQEHWILGRTIRENVLFGEEFDDAKYTAVLKACQLEEDLLSFPKGDLTRVGERGTRLSGGQKARLALARACYHVDLCEVFVFDDPLKDLDSKVTNRVFRSCLMRWLIGKTRILFTHNLQVLPHVDRVVVLEEGKIVRQGSYSELRDAAMGISPSELMRSPLSPLAMDAEDLVNRPNPTSHEYRDKDNEDELELEKLGGSFNYCLIWKYITTRPFLFVVFLICLVIRSAGELCRDYVAGMWADDREQISHSTRFYILVYLALGFFVSFVVVIAQVSFAVFSIRVADLNHNAMLSKVLRAPVSWFDKQTSGKILNRFSKDMEQMDGNVRWKLRDSLSNALRILSTYGFVVFFLPWFALLLILPVFLFVKSGRTFYKAFIGYVRLESGLHSPILTHFNETVKGLTTLRAFKKQDLFSEELENRIDLTWKVSMMDSTLHRWLAMRGRMVAILVLLLFTVLSIAFGLEGAIAAIALSRMSNMEFDVAWGLMMLPGLQKAFISVERIQEYAATETEDLTGRELSKFPKEGRVDFANVFFRYEVPNAEDVLKDVSLHISGGMKVGIVGRTGSGKSTLVKLLLRLYQPTSGEILIDGLSISQVSLKCLRMGMSYIAQNPTLLNGTVRENLDAAGVCDEERLWHALEQVGLRDKVLEAPNRLDAEVGEDINFSSGEKQLVCFARALVHKKRLLVMDEATSSCDLETDRKIQEVVDRCFADCTIIAIAHRLETIGSYDRIAVLSDGNVVEFDTPRALLANDSSLYREMVVATGRRRAQKLFDMANLRVVHDDEDEAVLVGEIATVTDEKPMD